MRYTTMAVVGLLIAAATGQAKQVPVRQTHLEFRPFGGMYLPQGDQGRDFRAAPTYGLQAAVELGSFTHIVAALSWTDGQSKLGALTAFPKTQVWQYDIGAEFSSQVDLSPRTQIRPFFGLGAGARNYNYPDKGLSSSMYPAAYYTLGSELRRGAMGLRFEGRSYLSYFRAPLDRHLGFRDDMFVTVGLVYHTY